MCYLAAMELGSQNASDVSQTSLLEVRAVRCARCDAELSAEEFSDGRDAEWPVLVAVDAAAKPSLHRSCGGRIELTDVRAEVHVCPEDCECGSGGLPERVAW